MPNPHIIGWGKYLPPQIVTNEELAARTGMDAAWLQDRTGIEARHFAEPHQATSDLALVAARNALDRAGITPHELNLIIVATNTPDHLFPITGCILQDALGATNAATFDQIAGCSGFLYSLITATQFIQTGAYQNILVVAAETLSRFIDWNDKPTCALFGDGAAAVVLSARAEPGGLRAFHLAADGSGKQMMRLLAGGSRHPLTAEALAQGWQYGQMDGGAAYRFGVRAMTRVAQQVLSKAQLSVADIALYIPHQSNKRLILQVTETLNLPNDKVFINLAQTANISNAAIPVALCDAFDAGRIHRGDKILMTAFGGGMTYAGVVWEW